MTRTTLPAAVALAASTALLLTACGGGSSDNSDKIQSSGTDTPSVTSSPTASPSPTGDGVKRPSTDLPKDLTMTFDWPKTGDATKDAVLNDAEQYLRAYNRAAASHDLKDPAYQFYSRDDALLYAHNQIKANIEGGWAPTGLDRYYSAKVGIVRSGSATLSFCEDMSKNYSKNVKTGKVIVTKPSDTDFAKYNVLLFKNATSNGVWQSSKITVVQGATQCKR